MYKISLDRVWRLCGAFAAVVGLTTAVQAVTVVEYYNATLDAYFITGRDSEKQALDAVPSFRRTGMTFQAAAAENATSPLVSICRFYVSVAAPFTSSHFYGRQGIECEAILAAAPAGFHYEGFDFAIAQPEGGKCPANLFPVYRGFRAGVAGKTANHRYTVSQATYATAIAAGYVGEGIVFCATAVTDVTPVVPVGTFDDCFSKLKFGSAYTEKQVTSSHLWPDDVTLPETTLVTRTTVLQSPPTALFHGRTANRIYTESTAAFDESGDLGASQISTTFEVETDASILTLGLRDETGDTIYSPPSERPKTMAVGQSVAWTRTATASLAGQLVTVSEAHTTTFRGREPVNVLAGAFPNACRFDINLTSAGADTVIELAVSLWVQGGLRLRSTGTLKVTHPGFDAYSVSTSASETTSATVIQ